MRIIRIADDLYPADVPARGRCSLCGMLFEFGSIVASCESDVDENSGGDVCPECVEVAPDELRRRMLSHVAMLRSQADELHRLSREDVRVEWEPVPADDLDTGEHDL